MCNFINSLLIFAAAVPHTGDNFPKGILIAVIAIAVIAVIITTILSKKQK